MPILYVVAHLLHTTVPHVLLRVSPCADDQQPTVDSVVPNQFVAHGTIIKKQANNFMGAFGPQTSQGHDHQKGVASRTNEQTTDLRDVWICA